MIVFDSNISNKWSGKGFAINKTSLVAYKNANFRHNISLSKGSYTLRVFAKNRTGSTPLFYKLVTERNIVITSGKLSLSKNWSEESFNFEILKNYGKGYLYIYRDSNSFGSSEVGRIILEREENIDPKFSKNRRVIENKIKDVKVPVRKFSKRKIGFVIPYNIYGGAEKYLETLISNLDTNLFQIHLLYLKDNPLRLVLGDNSLIHKKISSLENFINYVNIQKLDYLLYYNSIQAYRLVQKSILNINKKPKIIEIYHSDFKWGDSLSSLKTRNNIDLAFKVAPNLLSNISGIKKQVHLPVPLDVEKFCIRDIEDFNDVRLNLKDNKKIIGTVARLSEEKNIDYILDLSKILKEFNFLIFGEGNKEQELRKRITYEKIQNVHLLGFKRDVYRYYNIFDAFLLTSKMEGTPISILEAMASGSLVFTTNVGEINSILEDNKTGFFITGDLEKDSQLIQDNIFRQDVILNARKYIEDNHDQNIIAAKFVSEILEIQNHFTKRGTEELLSGEYI